MNLKECIQEALERYDRYTANENMSHAGMAQMVADALSTSSPASEPVTVEELSQELAFSYQGCSILKDSFYLSTAEHLLTKFTIGRKDIKEREDDNPERT